MVAVGIVKKALLESAGIVSDDIFPLSLGN